jgi:hypothetical protein
MGLGVLAHVGQPHLLRLALASEWTRAVIESDPTVYRLVLESDWIVLVAGVIGSAMCWLLSRSKAAAPSPVAAEQHITERPTKMDARR